MALNLTGFAPTTLQNTAGQVIEPIPSASIVITPFAPNNYQQGPGITEAVPSAALVLTPYAPNDMVRLREQIVNSSITITSFAPTTYQNGRITESVPSATLRLVSFSPNIPRTNVVPVRAGGGPRPAHRRVIILDGQRKVVESTTELRYLLTQHIRKKELELRRVEADSPKSTRVRVLKSQITKAETKRQEIDKWEIEQENEEILLMLLAS